jgi:ubiquinone/menaquinone biosynthesis C-methylase UbiE
VADAVELRANASTAPRANAPMLAWPRPQGKLLAVILPGMALTRFRSETVKQIGASLAYRVEFARLSRQLVWKRWYPSLTRRLIADDVLFLNFGYEEDPPMGLPLVASDEPNRFYIQLYHRTATQADITGARVLEVSCGHGGGASYLVRTLRPASYTGLDFNPAGVAFCRERHNLPDLDFVQGDAENLPFADQSFDAVINIQASHCYPQFPRFLTEVARVLRPGGHFLYTDLRSRHLIADWESAIAEAPMGLRSERIVNAEVLRAIEKNSHWSLNLLDRHLPAFLRRFGREFAVAQGSQIYRDLQRGELSFRMYWFAKD